MLDNIQLINFINLTLDEKKQVLLWRNHPDIKKWMYNQNNITLKHHLNFINLLKNDKTKLYFLLQKNNDYLGIINFTKISSKSSIFFGFYANPYTKLTGLGRIIDKVSINYAFKKLKKKTLKLECFSNNFRAINLHKKFNFIKTDSKIVNAKEIICMELKNENR